MSVHYVIETGDSERLQVTTFGNENFSNNKCLIFVHGFKGFKDWGFGPYIGEYFAKRGFFLITFNFSHNGIGNSPTDFTLPDKFASNTFSREISELSLVLQKYKEGFWGNVDKVNIGLLGHSRGGAISLLTAPYFKDVKGIVTWASIAKLDRYSRRQKEQWEAKGYIEAVNAGTKQILRINKTLLDDIELHGDDRLNIKKTVESLSRPLLFAQGDQDLVVRPKEAEMLYEWSDKNTTELFWVKGAGHTFGITHPFEGSNEKFELLLQRTNSFFNDVL